ncbi:restriction endonuclease subunit S [Helicobacter pylori]
MSEWQTFCLKDLGKIVGGATPPTNNHKNYGNKIAWITPKDLSTLQGRYIKKGSRNISRLGLNHALVCCSQNMPFYFPQELP